VRWHIEILFTWLKSNSLISINWTAESKSKPVKNYVEWELVRELVALIALFQSSALVKGAYAVISWDISAFGLPGAPGNRLSLISEPEAEQIHPDTVLISNILGSRIPKSMKASISRIIRLNNRNWGQESISEAAESMALQNLGEKDG